jgi:hypothetical protein
MAHSDSGQVAPSQLASISFEADGCVMGSRKNITFAVWGTQGTLPLAMQFAKLSDDVGQVYPMVSTIHLILDDVRLPTADARKVLDDLTDRFTRRLACLATVVEGSGFRASAMRSFLTGMHMLQRQSYKAKTCETILEVANWLAPRHSAASGVPVVTDELLTTLTAVLAHPTIRSRR